MIETERLTLRRLEPGDHEAVYRWNADPEFTRHLAGVQTREQTDAAIARWERHWAQHGFGIYIAAWRETGEPVGRVGLQFHSHWPDDPEVGWAFDPAWWGRGLATEAGRACVEHGFGELGYTRLASITTEQNLASRNVMHKLGFELHTQVPSVWGPLWIHVRDR